jgi:hypothetical protein
MGYTFSPQPSSPGPWHSPPRPIWILYLYIVGSISLYEIG